MSPLLSLLLPLASVTDKLAEWTTNVVDDIGLIGIFILMTLESACIPIPSEPTMLFAGFASSDGAYPLWAPVLVATFANLCGSWIAYAAGYYGRIELLERQKFIHISPKHLARADGFFEKYGDYAVFFGRMLPIIRTFISLPAGVSRMPIVRFSVLTFLGALPWNLALVLAGHAARDNWSDIKDKLHYFDYFIAALILAGAVYLAVRWIRTRRNPRDPAADTT
jgi:membrane protein DedA with SNARE-associated domain